MWYLIYCVVLTVACEPPPNEYFLDSESKVNGVIPSDEELGTDFEVNRRAERCCSQKEVTNSSGVCFIA